MEGALPGRERSGDAARQWVINPPLSTVKSMVNLMWCVMCRDLRTTRFVTLPEENESKGKLSRAALWHSAPCRGKQQPHLPTPSLFHRRMI